MDLSGLILYHDFLSPFSRLALVVARNVVARTGVELQTTPLELFPAPLDIPAGVLAAELRAAGPLAAELRTELVLPRVVPRTRKAHETVAHARDHGLELAVAEALYDGMWRRGLDIGRLDVLVELGGAVGLDRDLLHVSLGLDARAEEVMAASRAAEAAGVDGVPTFRLGEALAVGLYSPAKLLEWIEAHSDPLPDERRGDHLDGPGGAGDH